MGVVRKIKNNELVGGTTTEDVYPITSNKAVFDSDNISLETLLYNNMPINISSSYTNSPSPITLSAAIALVPNEKRKYGFIGMYLSSESNSWEIIKYEGTTVDQENWSNTDNWSKILSEKDVTNEEGNSTTKVMSQKAVTDFVKSQSTNKVTYNLASFDALNVGDNIVNAFTPISGYDQIGIRYPEVGDLLYNYLSETYTTIIYSKDSSYRDITQVIIYINLSGLNFIYIQDNIVTEVKRNTEPTTRTYNLDKFRDLKKTSNASEALTPINSQDVILPEVGDILKGSNNESTNIIFKEEQTENLQFYVFYSYIDGTSTVTLKINKGTYIVEGIDYNRKVYNAAAIMNLSNGSTLQEFNAAITPMGYLVPQYPSAGDIMVESMSSMAATIIISSATAVIHDGDNDECEFEYNYNGDTVTITKSPTSVTVAKYSPKDFEDTIVSLPFTTMNSLTSEATLEDIYKALGGTKSTGITYSDVNNRLTALLSKKLVVLNGESSESKTHVGPLTLTKYVDIETNTVYYLNYDWNEEHILLKIKDTGSNFELERIETYPNDIGLELQSILNITFNATEVDIRSAFEVPDGVTVSKYIEYLLSHRLYLKSSDTPIPVRINVNVYYTTRVVSSSYQGICFEFMFEKMVKTIFLYKSTTSGDYDKAYVETYYLSSSPS